MDSQTEFREKNSNQNQLLSLINKTMRHDLLNDLTIINNSLEAYKDNKDERLLENALNIVKRSFELVEDMKELEALVFTDTRLKPYSFRKAVENVGDRYQVDINVEGDCHILADRALNSVVDNIIRNAVRHGQADRVDIHMEDMGDFCHIRISDNGLGVPEEIKERIFEEGYSSSKDGSGLGLYIVRKTIERYGGTIQVEQNQPRGTIFILRLYSS